MQTITREYKVYSFDELSEEAKERVIEKNFDINTDYEWFDCIYEDAREIGKILGIDIDNIYFSGFSSQGDGACFEGSYSYNKKSVQKIKEYAPKDTELHNIAQKLQDIQKRNFYRLFASIKHSGHYSHSGCTQINITKCIDLEDYASIEDDELLSEALRDFMDWIYKQLETQYWFLVSDEQIEETLKANNYQFLENGSIFN